MTGMHIQPGDLVLEIGSGHRPHPRSTVLVDKFMDCTEERSGKVTRDSRPLINAEGESLPFRDKSFDYVICNHVLEHSANPSRFLEEMQRVGQRGFVEAPSPVWKLIYTPREYHRCLVYWDKQENQLLVKLRHEDEYSHFGRLFAYLYENDIFFRLFHQHNQELLYTRLEWEEFIPFRVLDPDQRILPDLFDLQAIQRLLGPKVPLRSTRGRWLYRLICFACKRLCL